MATVFTRLHYLIHRPHWRLLGVSTASGIANWTPSSPRNIRCCTASVYKFWKTLGQKLDLEPRRIDMLLLALWLHKQGPQPKQVTHAVILAWLCHRQQYRQRRQPVTEKYDFESFDMPLDVTPEAIARQVMRYLEEHPRLRRLFSILVDILGSLKAIHRHFDRALSTPVTIINNVSTSMACGERILQGHFGERSPAISPGMCRSVSALLAKSNKPRAILTTCTTGIGVATNLARTERRYSRRRWRLTSSPAIMRCWRQ
ncbi:hypothetical protein KCP75_24200 [Salmonella enterica subsp. enterica]|nr:hypothetical protein KCP75_24200 [Salmonella enterica subsp. enterica]